MQQQLTYWQRIGKQYSKQPLGMIALGIVMLYIVVGIYAPLFASSKPLVVQFDGEWFFPLFRYLFDRNFYSKELDIFYNLLMFTLPIIVLTWISLKKKPQLRSWVILLECSLHCIVFLFLILFPLKDPALRTVIDAPVTWNEEVNVLKPYEKLNLVLRYHRAMTQKEKLEKFRSEYEKRMMRRGQSQPIFPTLWNLTYGREEENQKKRENSYSQFMLDRRLWVEEQQKKITFLVMPFFRPFHWEEDAGGDQTLNQIVDWQELTRINRKDMVASLLFGIRVSLSVGLLAIGIALLIGVPIGALSGYYGGIIDLVTYRMIEIWESMPIFFMLLLIVGFFQTKSIFLIIAIIGFFGWTHFSRFVRAEFLRQKQLLYVEACHAIGYKNSQIIFSHLLPNAIPPLLTLVPFAIMAAITNEAALSFLGLGEEGSNSWGVLMDEGRSAFPSESYLLWPPAILLTILLVSIALVGDSLRDALDPKLHIVHNERI